MEAFDYYNNKFVPNNKAKSLGTNPQSITSIAGQLLTDGLIIRRLTPVECERLQSLPSNYTEGISDTQRYKVLGNGFNCAVIKHIINSLIN